MSQGQVTLVIGAQWGDEGKGKWVDILAEKVKIVARYQGGNNAGHTIYVGGEKKVLHQIPSGIFQKGLTCALSSGVVINPTELVKELDRVASVATVTPENLWLSARAHVITPFHRWLDADGEARATQPIGTTKRGIGPTYADKAARRGLRLGIYIDVRALTEWIEERRATDQAFAKHWQEAPAEWAEFQEAAGRIAPLVCDAEHRLREAVRSGAALLGEGAQGTLLDLDHGTFPFVTSSSTAAGGASATLGLPPQWVSKTYGVAKAYTTRVGSGPMPTELFDDAGKHMATKGAEFGATTGRPRRCGWLDGVALRYAQALNGFDGIILNKMDILTGLSELKIAVAYNHPTLGRLDTFPWNPTVLAACTPVYETFAGWTEALPAGGSMAQLPGAAKVFIAGVERITGGRVTMVGTGVNRENALF